MGLFDFFRKCREREKEKTIAETKRGIALIKEVCDWLREDPENRALLVCMAAVTGTWNIQQDIDRTEKQWRFMMTEHNHSSEIEGS